MAVARGEKGPAPDPAAPGKAEPPRRPGQEVPQGDDTALGARPLVADAEEDALQADVGGPVGEVGVPQHGHQGAARRPPRVLHRLDGHVGDARA